MIYDFLFAQDPERRWIFFFRGKQWNPPSSSPLVNVDKKPLSEAPKHQISLYMACRQIQAEFRRELINTGKDSFEFLGFNALNRFMQNYAYTKITALTLISELQHWVIRPGQSHSSDLDNFIARFEWMAFPNLKRLGFVVNDFQRHNG